ncbi:RHS repeat domain-containing protein [Arthrobacter sp. MDB2-24]
MSAHTTDGSHIEYQAHWRFQGVGHRSPRLQSGWLVRSNGTRVDFDFRTGGTVHATRLTDRNGNVIDVGYDATIQRLSKIIDTCGQVISFVYRENKFGEMVLARVLGPAPNADWSAPATDTDLVRLNMSSRELRTSFQDPVHEPASRVPIISGIYYPATGTGYWLPPSSYSSYGMLKLVQACRGMSLGPTTSNTDGPPIVAGPVTWQREYNYPDSPGLEQKDAPTYTTMSESWDGGSAVTTEFLVQRTVTGARTEITWPDNAKTVHEVDSAGLLKELRVMDPWGQVLQRTQMDHWQIAPDGTPQILAVDVTDDAGHVAKTTFFYGGPSTEPTIVDQWNHAPHRDAAVRVLRRTEIDYVTDERYLRRNLRNLLKAVRVFGQFDPYLTNARPLASRIEYEYDQTPLVPAPGIVGFDAKFDPASPGYAPETTWRGNPTTTRRYTNAATGSFPVAETRTYDLAGNLFRSEIGPGRVEYKYTPAFRFLIPATIRLTGTQASAPTMELTNTVTATWGGSPVYVTDANGQATIHGYDAAGRLTSTTSVATGSGTQVVIDDTARTRATTTTSGGPGGPRLEYATTATLNGRGRTTSTRTQDVQGDVTVSYQYDFRERLRLVTAPHRDGDPYKFSSVDLDQLDRPLELIDLNRGVTRWYYNENARPDNRVSSDQELFATVRVVGANGTEQWKSFDALNRLREAVDPAPDGPGTILPTGALCTSYSYDGLDNITAIDLHTAGMPVQHRRFRHDSLGRLVRQYLPERGTGISETVDGATQYWSDSFTYDERSNLIQKEDSRGILTNFEYANDPFNRLQQVFGNPGPFRDHGHPVHVTGPVYYEYETNGDLRRVHIENCSGVSQRTYDHDPVVGLTSVTTTMSLAPDRPFTIDYDHDRLARVRATTFPARYGDDAGAGNQRPVLEVTRQFGGLVDELSVNGDTLVHGTAYTAAGQISHLLIGPNDIDESYKRDLPNPLLLSGQSLSHANAAFSNVDYNYHPAATASRQPPQLHVTEDLLDPSKTRVATYDRLGRLDDYDGGPQPTGIWGEKYRYDLHGNRLSATPRGEIVPGTPAPSDGLQELAYEDSTNRVLTAGFNNDAAGNLTSARINGIDYKYQYDLAGRLAWVHNGATQEVTGYLFGACNRRRATIRLGATTWPPTHHPGGVPPTEIKSATFYIWDEDTVIATYEANGPDIQNTLAWKRTILQPR